MKMAVKTQASVFQITNTNVCLLKLSVGFMLLLSVPLEVPVNAMSGHLGPVATAEHGIFNFGPLILSNDEADRVDPGRCSKWWQKKRGLLGSGVLALLTAAAALFATFLILQCFQKLQQHRGSTPSLRKLADDRSPCDVG